MAEQEQDRSEQATPFKLQEARRRGQVVRSTEINSFFLIAGALALLSLWGSRFISQGLAIERAIFDRAADLRYDIPELTAWLGAVGAATAKVLAPLFLLVVAISILASLAQTGPIFTFFPLKPDPKRLNPVQGFKRVFSLRMLFEAVKTVIKLTLYTVVAYVVISDMLSAVLGMPHMDPRGYPTMLLQAVTSLVFKLVLAILLVALLDLIYTRWDFGKKMRMSRREVKEEIKRREGDPLVRAKIKELQREAAKRAQSVRRVPDADVLITNPTHFAVALEYKRGTMKAPRLIAKGAGDTAATMKAVARRAGVPIVERPSVARQLFREVDIDHPIPESVFEPIARIYAEIFAAQQGAVRVGVKA
ncbi:MAG: flagellar biosynthesis protein FlhB [Sulfurifustis sp.]